MSVLAVQESAGEPTRVPASIIDRMCAGVSVLRLISLTAGKCCLTAPLVASLS